MVPQRKGRLRRLVPLVALALLASLLIAASSPPRRDFWLSGDSQARAEAILATLDDEEVLGQLFMMAYPGDTPPDLLYSWIRERGLGGVKIFGWNAEDSDKLAAVIASIQKAALGSGRGIPLLVATDQEGGWIRHVKGKTSVTPGNMAIGASGRPYDAWWSAYYIGRELSALGINMNFAPAVDLATRPRSTIIGPRAFSADPAVAASLGVAYYRGLAAAGVIATAKHFPGHGDTDLDSHGVLPVISLDEKTLWRRELLPFRALSDEGVPAIMSGHLNFPQVTKDTRPASLSRWFMTDLLRGQMGFKGLAVTDDLLMAGATASASLPLASRQAIEAGNDLLMTSRIIGLEDPTWTSLLEAYRKEPAFKARVREAATRVIKLKLDYLRPKGEAGVIPDLAKLPSEVPDSKGQAFFAGQARRAATALDPSLLPWKPTGTILVAAPYRDFLEAASVAYPGSRSFRYQLGNETRAADLGAFSKAAAGAEAVIVCVQGESTMAFVDAARALGKKVAIISLLSPEPLARRRPGEAAIAVYGLSRQCMEAGLSVLKGDGPSLGSLPLVLAP